MLVIGYDLGLWYVMVLFNLILVLIAWQITIYHTYSKQFDWLKSEEKVYTSIAFYWLVKLALISSI